MDNKGIQPGHVVSALLSDDKKGYVCTMSDGSTWTCDLEGGKWKKVGISTAELTEKFKEFFRSERKKEKIKK